MKIRLLLFFLLFLHFSFAQTVIKGVVKNEAGIGIPGVRISVENTTYGVASNNNGAYFLEVENQSQVIIKYGMFGFETTIDTIVLSGPTVIHDIVLRREAEQLGEVEVVAEKGDVAKEIMQKVIDTKKNIQRQYETYQCETYIKTSLEKEDRFQGLKDVKELANPDGLESDVNIPVRQKMNFIESYSITRFKQNDTYRESVLAHNDYSEKSNSTVTVSANFSDPNSILPSQSIAYNPYIFFEKVQDGDFDPYQNLINLPKVSSNPLVSPIALNAFINYKFSLVGVFEENGQEIFDILVEPRFSEAPLFSGHLYIIDSLWVIKSMDLSINPSAMAYFKDFRIIQDYEQIEGKWVPVRREFSYTINDGMNIVMANTRVSHKNYLFNLDFDKNTFKNVLMDYDVDAFNKDSAYWANTRPIQLKEEELAFIHEQDSIEKLLTSDAYIDSVNTEYNRLRFWDFVLSGVGFRNREKQQEIYINPLISQIVPFGVGGYRHRLGGMYSKEFENAQKIRVNGTIDYGFRNKDLKGDLGIEYTFDPLHFGSFKISGGDNYDFVTMEQSIANFFSPSNYVRKTFINISQRYELVNGLYGKVTFDYSTRRDISYIAPGPVYDTLSQIFDWPLPVPYETYTVSILEFQFIYRFKQKYILKGNKKLIVGTEMPELRLRYKAGIPRLFGSDVNFNFLEISASDKITFGTFGDMKWSVEAGTFFGKMADQVQYVERQFFRGSDVFFFSNPLSTMQLLDATFNTTQPYLQAFAIHHFKGAIMNKIPLINKLKLELVAGAGMLLIDSENYEHIEFYAGLERKLKIRSQLFKVGVFYVVRQNNASSVSLNFKIGLDFFNSFTNNWSY